MVIVRIRPIYLRIYKNRLVVCSPESKICIEKTGNFSNPRLAIADFKIFESLLSETIIKLVPKRWFSFMPPAVYIIVQQFDLLEGGISPVEKRALIDSCEHSFAKKIEIIKSNKVLTYEHVMDIFNKM